MEYSDHVFIDVHSWVSEIAEKREFVIVGAYRASYLHCKVFTPAMFCDDLGRFTSEAFTDAVAVLEKNLGKQITILHLGIDSFDRCLWICSSVDHFPFFLSTEILGLRKAAILHDTLAFEGVFGEQNKLNFISAVKYVEIFLYVSETSKESLFRIFSDINLERYKKFIPLPNACQITPQAFDYATTCDRRPLSSLSVSSIYPYKNIFRTLEIALHSLTEHYHIGRFYQEDKALFNKLVEDGYFYYTGPVPDSVLNNFYLSAQYFICMSKKEGFSLPALEALLLGVPIIILSDIPVHREIYGRYNVNFVPVEQGNMSFLGTGWKRTTLEDRKDAAKRYSYLEASRAFLEYCAEGLAMDLSHYERK